MVKVIFHSISLGTPLKGKNLLSLGANSFLVKRSSQFEKGKLKRTTA